MRSDDVTDNSYERWLEEEVRPKIAEVCASLGEGETWPSRDEVENWVDAPGSGIVRDVLRIAAEELTRWEGTGL